METQSQISSTTSNLVNAFKELGIDPLAFSDFLHALLKVSAASEKLLTDTGINPITARGFLNVEIEVTFRELLSLYNPPSEQGKHDALKIIDAIDAAKVMAVMK